MKNKKTNLLRINKEVNKAKMSKDILMREMKIMNSLNHAYIARVEEYYEDKLNYYIISEY